MENQNFYVEKTYHMLIQHGLENIVEKLLKENPALIVIDGQSGSQLMVVKKNELGETN